MADEATKTVSKLAIKNMSAEVGIQLNHTNIATIGVVARRRALREELSNAQKETDTLEASIRDINEKIKEAADAQANALYAEKIKAAIDAMAALGIKVDDDEGEFKVTATITEKKKLVVEVTQCHRYGSAGRGTATTYAPTQELLEMLRTRDEMKKKLDKAINRGLRAREMLNNVQESRDNAEAEIILNTFEGQPEYEQLKKYASDIIEQARKDVTAD